MPEFKLIIEAPALTTAVNRLANAILHAGSSAQDWELSNLPTTPDPVTPGVKGLVFLHCSACGSDFRTFLREKQSSASCQCGYKIDLTVPLAHYSFTCPHCGKATYGSTNLDEPELLMRCQCGKWTRLSWLPQMQEYSIL